MYFSNLTDKLTEQKKAVRISLVLHLEDRQEVGEYNHKHQETSQGGETSGGKAYYILSTQGEQVVVEQYQRSSQTSVQSEHDAGLSDELVVTAAGEETGRTRVGVTMHQGWASYLIPHLSRYHNQYDSDGEESPIDRIVEGVQLFSHPVATQHHEQEEDTHGEQQGVVGRTEQADLNRVSQ